MPTLKVKWPVMVIPLSEMEAFATSLVAAVGGVPDATVQMHMLGEQVKDPGSPFSTEQSFWIATFQAPSQDGLDAIQEQIVVQHSAGRLPAWLGT